MTHVGMLAHGRGLQLGKDLNYTLLRLHSFLDFLPFKQIFNYLCSFGCWLFKSDF